MQANGSDVGEGDVARFELIHRVSFGVDVDVFDAPHPEITPLKGSYGELSLLKPNMSLVLHDPV